MLTNIILLSCLLSPVFQHPSYPALMCLDYNIFQQVLPFSVQEISGAVNFSSSPLLYYEL